MPTQRLFTDLNVNLAGYCSGREEEICAFSRSVGADPRLLLAGSIRVGLVNHRFRGEDFRRSSISGYVSKYCPLCLKADGDIQSWKYRILWIFTVVCQCPAHGCSLVSVGAGAIHDLREADEGNIRFNDLSHQVECKVDLASVIWLQRRLDGVPDEGWLAGQSIEQVMSASEMIGATLAHGNQVRLTELKPATRAKAFEQGFEIYRRGEDHVADALLQIRSRSSAKAVQAGPLASYGSLFDWLQRRSNSIDPGPIRRILREQILEHTAVASGEFLLGEKVETRRLHSLQSLSKETGVSRRRISRLFQKIGLVPAGATDAESGMLVYPVEQVANLCDDFHDTIPLKELARYIGASPRQAEALYNSGVVEPLIPPTSPGSVRNVVFARSYLDRFLAVIERLEPLNDAPGFVPISSACQSVGVTTSDLVRAVWNGTVTAWRNEEETGLTAVLVKAADVRQWKSARLMSHA